MWTFSSFAQYIDNTSLSVKCINKGIELNSIDIALGTPSQTFKEIEEQSPQYFIKYRNEQLQKDSTYWFRISLNNKYKKEGTCYLHFNNLVSNIELYQPVSDSLYAISKGGTLISLSERTVKEHIKDLVPFALLPNTEIILYLKIRNQLANNDVIQNLNLVSEDDFETKTADINLLQGILLGILIVLLSFNFILYIFSHNRLYFLYSIYILFTALFLANTVEITERFLFPNQPMLDVYAQWGYLLSQFIYLLFFIELIKIENRKKWQKGIFLYAITMLLVLVMAFYISLFNYRKAMILNDIYSIANVFFVTLSFFALFRKVKLTTRIILAGSLFTVLGALITIILSFNDIYTNNLIYFQTGIFIELLLFTIAINYTYTQETMSKQLIIREKEDENKSLIVEINDSHRALATKSLMIQEKETLLTNLIDQLSTLDSNNNTLPNIRSVIIGLKQNLTHKTWAEVEIHFNKVHPLFYSQLHEKFPNITPNERKLCAFLKLNLSTKEIATITGKSANTIDVARSRLRKKMNLENAENLQTIISTIG